MPLFARTPAAVLLIALSAISAAAQTAWHEEFEGQQASWRDAGGNAQYRVLQHQRLQQDAHTGKGCEWLQIEAGGGAQVYFAHDIGRPRIIDELAPSVWIKSDRAGPHFALRVVLPRTIDPRSGQPVATVLTGAAYTDVGRWQQMGFTGIPALLTRQIHVLRMQFGPQVDGREAYVDAVLLNVCGGPGVTNVWIDDLDVPGYAAAQTGQTQQEGPSLSPQVPAGSWTPKAAAADIAPLVPVRLPPVTEPQGTDKGNLSALPKYAANVGTKGAIPSRSSSDAAPRRTVRLVGSVLLVNGRPMFPRVVLHRGEPLATLKHIGFNTVWLSRLPAPELLEEADRLGLWLICPPPRALTPMADIGPAFDCVLAWDLGSDLAEADLEATERWADQVRAADRRGKRPLVCCPRADLRGFSRPANLLLIDRRPLGTSLEMTAYATWVRQQPLLATPGTPVWTTVQTQPNEALRQQLSALEPGSAPPLCVPPEQVRLLAYTAVSAGSRGLVFLSDSPLDAADPETQQRAMTLELLNLELELMEPWAAAGSVVANADSNVPEVLATVLHTDRARLLLPIWSAPMAQYVPPQSASNALALVVPGVPEASDAYELTPSGVQSLRHKRVTGGIRVVLDEFGLTTQVLLAHDPSIVGAVHRRAAEVGRRAAELQRHLAVRKLNTVQALAGQLAARSSIASAATWLDDARKNLQTCDGQLAAGDGPGAAQNAQRAMRALRMVERAYWDAAVKGLAAPVTSPGAVSFDTLPSHWRLVARLAAHRFGPSRIAGGDFEDLDTMMRAGWRFIQHSSASLQTAADLAPDAARSGRLGLRLAVAPLDPKKPPAVVEAPPVLFTSPSVQVEAGQIVCVYGWVQVPAPITGSADGLLIVDSLSGEALADRIGQTDGWRQFALYRVAPQSGPMCVTFALSGLGEARIDDVAIQVIEGPAAVTQR
jgi:hypothetical protein